MAATRFSMRTILAQQTERTKGSAPTQIKQFIVDSDSRVDSLQNEIVALESQIAALVELRDRECATGAALRSLIAPIRTLPAELLAEIFVLTIRRDLKTPRLSVHVGDNSLCAVQIKDPFRVSHVCRHWRRIATGLPELWTGTVEVPFSPKLGEEEEEGEKYVNGLRAWFARSKPHAVSIAIRTPPYALSQTEFGSRLAGELRHVATRTRSLRFLDRASAWLVQHVADGRWDSLEELELGGVVADDDSDDDFVGTTILSFQTTAPQLRTLSIDLCSRIPMPWGQLTNLTILRDSMRIIPPEYVRDILSQCKNLVRASVFVVGWADHPPPKTDMLALDHLRVLTVHCIGDATHVLFLDYLSAPALDDFQLYFPYNNGDTEWPQAALTAFQLRSPNITKLKIDGSGFTMSADALIAALRHAPSLTDLTLVYCLDFSDNALLNVLCYTDGSLEPLVPRLHSLTIGEIHQDASQDGLARMITSRWWSDTKLASRPTVPAVARWRQIILIQDDSLSWGFKPSPKFQDRMDELRQSGLAVELIDYDSFY
ncbi:F-box domain-containing protein [Mycena sanguinolenta]|uniref:F-box domain-containing protein n=1 Tax=Mycena sanguinolenta TaxID=230812 RepID=A0A8H7D113_9AGAR|nr:F-box domain-containing protein [Mycena sanguinolenta]